MTNGDTVARLAVLEALVMASLDLLLQRGVPYPEYRDALLTSLFGKVGECESSDSQLRVMASVGPLVDELLAKARASACSDVRA
jgi:hypothetical protein